jgi:uncharacterized membrane protein (DUF485 family)
MQHLYRRIYADPEFHELELKRGRFSWLLASIILIAYFSFILIIAFFPELFGIPIMEGSVITWGIPVALCVILLSFLLTGIYVYRANKEFDQLVNDVVEQAQKIDKDTVGE